MLFWLKKFISFWLMPMSFCVAGIVVGLVLMQRKKFARAGRTLLLASLAVMLLFSNKFVSKALMRPLETQFPAIPELVDGQPLPADLAACQYVVILGSGNGHTPGLSANNLLSRSSLGRVTEGVRLLHALPHAKMIICASGDANHESHATVVGRAAHSLGIARDRMLFGTHALDTEDEANAVQKIAPGARIALVSSASHLPRAVPLFRSAGLNPLPCPADFETHSGDEFYFDDLLWGPGYLGRSSQAIREWVGRLWIALRGKT